MKYGIILTGAYFICVSLKIKDIQDNYVEYPLLSAITPALAIPHKIPKSKKYFSIEDIECLAKNIYFEARNQSIDGQYAVGWVTLNRLDHKNYPSTICEVVWQDKQFSWTHDGKSDNPKETKAWELSKDIAYSIINQYNNKKYDADMTKGSLMYHADYVSPWWKTHYIKSINIDSHIFYRKRNNNNANIQTASN